MCNAYIVFEMDIHILYDYDRITTFVLFYWLLYAAAGDPNAWRLGRIEETDHETPV